MRVSAGRSKPSRSSQSGSRAAAGGIDDEVGAQHPGGGGAGQPDTGDTVAVGAGEQAVDGRAVEQGDTGCRQDAGECTTRSAGGLPR